MVCPVDALMEMKNWGVKRNEQDEGNEKDEGRENIATKERI